MGLQNTFVVVEMYKNDGNLSNCQRVSWNKQGSGLMFEDLDIPVVLLHNESDVEFIIDQVSSLVTRLVGRFLSVHFFSLQILLRQTNR